MNTNTARIGNSPGGRLIIEIAAATGAIDTQAVAASPAAAIKGSLALAASSTAANASASEKPSHIPASAAAMGG